MKIRVKNDSGEWVWREVTEVIQEIQAEQVAPQPQ